MDFSGFLDESQDIKIGILDFKEVFCQLEVSRVIIIFAKTTWRCDVTVSVYG